MSDRPLLSAALICKNEAANIERCLASLWDHVDEVCIADTGSTDGTLGVARKYAEARAKDGSNTVLKTRTFLDCNDPDGHIRDFSAARNAADELASGEWLVWADLDDTVVGLGALRRMAEQSSPGVVAFFCRYRYAADPDKNPISELWRERVVRNVGIRWEGRLHEHKLFQSGEIVKVGPDVAEWLHHRDHTVRTGDRNLRILEDWLNDEPGNPRILHSLAMELLGAERHPEAVDTFAKYLACAGEPPDRRAQATRQMCMALQMQNRVDEAKAAALLSFGEFPLWADTHLTLSEAAHAAGKPHEAILHAQTALQIGKPDTLLIINPLQYTAHPHALIAISLAQLGRIGEAIEEAQECLRIAPSYQLANSQLPLWRSVQKKQNAVEAFIACQEVLSEAGELEKAVELLRQVPWYIAEEPRVIARRAEVFREVNARLAAGAVISDDVSLELVERLKVAA